MPKSASDATRFTPTSPHAYSKPASSSARLSAPQPNARPGPGHSRAPKKAPGPVTGAPSGETPAEKVARLRAAHAARRAAEISTFDRIVVRGRAVADAVHRVTVFGIVGLSGKSGPALSMATASLWALQLGYGLMLVHSGLCWRRHIFLLRSTPT